MERVPRFCGGDGSRYLPDGQERHERHERVLNCIEEHGNGALAVLTDPEDIRWAKVYLDPDTPADAFEWDAVPL
ncbi:MAG: hypothetical protein NTY38_02720 [Acidobacteria bacterium]|nr:hypothetical protein [Acidobacteriota bacterium]